MSTPALFSPGRLAELVTPVKSGNVFEETVEKILSLISAGLVPPQGKLPSERELTELLGVSRSAVREAIVELQKTGCIEVRRGRYGGAFVMPAASATWGEKKIDFTDLEDLLRYREVLESAIAQEAARQPLSAEQRAGLLARLKEVNEAPEHLYRFYDSRFHLYLAQLTGISRLAKGVVEMRATLNECLDVFPLIDTNITHSEEQHAAIAHAIMAGDPESAEEQMRSHVRGTASLIRGFLHHRTPAQ